MQTLMSSQQLWALVGIQTPAFMFGRNAQFNYMRYASDQNDSLLKDIRSDASFDADYRVRKPSKWQDLHYG